MNPEFVIKERNGKKSLWVNNHNIWDLTETELTPNVQAAIISAYFRGAAHMKEEISHINIIGQFGSQFEREDHE
jgi:hypothetical protein